MDTAARGGERIDFKVGDGAAEMVRLLRPFGARGMTEKQATFDAAFARNASSYAALDRRYAGPNFRNLIRQLESLRRVAALWRRSGVSYEAVVYARPDLKFLDAIDADQVLAVPSKTILDPYWHRWSGLNDRVLVCSRDAAAVVAARIELARRPTPRARSSARSRSCNSSSKRTGSASATWRCGPSASAPTAPWPRTTCASSTARPRAGTSAGGGLPAPVAGAGAARRVGGEAEGRDDARSGGPARSGTAPGRADRVRCPPPVE